MTQKLTEGEKTVRASYRFAVRVVGAVIKNGMKWLDENEPEWESRVLGAFDEFDIWNPSYCIAGLSVVQINGFENGYDALSSRYGYEFIRTHGFNVPHLPDTIPNDVSEYYASRSVEKLMQPMWEEALLTRAIQRGIVSILPPGVEVELAMAEATRRKTEVVELV